MADVACLALSTDLHAQRSGSKSANVELTTIPTVPFDDGAKVSTTRRFGEDIKIKLD